jgi:hypothetical protein
MSDYQAARQAVQTAIRGGGFTTSQADAVTAAVEQFCEAFFEAKLMQTVAAMPLQPPSSPR